MPFEHLKFARHWELSPETTYKLGQCRALIDCLRMMPLRPEIQEELKEVSLIKGAQATAAIEGNTLAEDEIRKISEGQQLPESKAYQQQEVDNILQAMHYVLQSDREIITPELLKRYHSLIGKDLPPPFNAIPGEFAQSQRAVGTYRCPPPGRGENQAEGLVKRLCDWLQKEFGYTSGKQTFRDAFIQAIVTHVYIEWIHPFDDGNGRTGRLVEYYLLLRAGVPEICAHILSNHYNKTRPEYYAHIQKAQNEKQLTSFIEYAVSGFLDGLSEIWKTIDEELLKRAWKGWVYDKFAEIKWSRPVFKRRRLLMLDLPLFEQYDIQSIQQISPEVARAYAKVNIPTVKRDIRELLETDLLIKDPATKKFSANTEAIKIQYADGLIE